MSTQSAAGPVVGILVRHSFAWLVWFWAIIAVTFTTIGVLTERFGTLDRSIWESAGAAPRWALFVLGILFGTMYLPFLVAHGVTRRTFVLAGAVAGGLVGLTAGAVMLAGYLAERAVYVRLDRPQYLEQEHLFGRPTEAHLVLAEYTLVFFAFLLSGWLVGLGYYRFGGIRGTLFLPPAMIPVSGVESVLATGWSDTILNRLSIGDNNLPAAVGLSLVLLAAGLAAAHAVTRTVAIKPRTT